MRILVTGAYGFIGSHIIEGLLVGVHTNGFGEIFITFAVVSNKFADFRQYFEGVDVVNLR